MSMRIVSYNGYGFDIANLVNSLDETEQQIYSDCIWNADIEAYYDDNTQVEIVLPCNTDDFQILFIISAVVPVDDGTKSPPKIFTKEEANIGIGTALAGFLEDLKAHDELPAEIADKMIRSIPQYVDAHAGYDWDKGPWTDCI